MRPTLVIVPALAIAAAVTLAVAPAFADPPNDLVVSGNGTVTIAVKSSSAFHLNNQFTWSIKDGSGKALKSTKNSPSDFTFSGGSADHPTTASVAVVAGTLKGGYCDNDPNKGGCHVFTATCTASTCTVNAQ